MIRKSFETQNVWSGNLFDINFLKKLQDIRNVIFLQQKQKIEKYFITIH